MTSWLNLLYPRGEEMMSAPASKLFCGLHLQRCAWRVCALRGVYSGNQLPLPEATSACPTTNRAGSFAGISNCRSPTVLHSCSPRVQQHRRLHLSPLSRGLEEFFPKTDDIIEEGEKNGRPWLARELRQKSNEDLHKLWHVLLKERNMLMTMRHEATRLRLVMPAPERMWKVRKGMARIKVVLAERERAIKEAKKVLKLEKKRELLSESQTVDSEDSSSQEQHEHNSKLDDTNSEQHKISQ